jgi:hypothetical protein
VLVKAGRWVISTARKLARLVDDLTGEPAHGDEPARPGLMDRVRRIEIRLTRVEAQVLPNGGQSLHDKVCRIEQATGAGD